MFGNSFFLDGNVNDPFFSMQRSHMDMMNSMMTPFGHMGVPALGITDGRENAHTQRSREMERRGERSRRPDMMNPMAMMGQQSMFGDMFGNMNSMMSHMNTAFQGAAPGNNDGHMFTQSSFTSYSNTGAGAPKVYQATSSTRQAPGGVRETRKSVRDSESGMQKMAVGHHIGERGHVVTRAHNVHTGDKDENQDYINLDEEEADDFNQEWRQRTTPYSRGNASITHSRSRHNPDRYTPSAQEAAKPRRERDLHVTGVKAKSEKKVKVRG